MAFVQRSLVPVGQSTALAQRKVAWQNTNNILQQGCVSMPPYIGNTYPHLNSRAPGWLSFLHQKSTTPDDWTEGGQPHEWWDKESTPLMCSFPRFDLQESTYAIGLMADQTPAWREIYAAILAQLAERFLTYWATVDWLSQFGTDPKRKEYPEAWKGTLIPEQFWDE